MNSRFNLFCLYSIFCNISIHLGSCCVFKMFLFIIGQTFDNSFSIVSFSCFGRFRSIHTFEQSAEESFFLSFSCLRFLFFNFLSGRSYILLFKFLNFNRFLYFFCNWFNFFNFFYFNFLFFNFFNLFLCSRNYNRSNCLLNFWLLFFNSLFDRLNIFNLFLCSRNYNRCNCLLNFWLLFFNSLFNRLNIFNLFLN